MKMIGARALIECLKKEQVQVVFGYPGGSVLTLYNELDQSDITHVLTGHEQGAVHAADGYARATGHTGVAFATSGPGVCNMVTGIAIPFPWLSSAVRSPPPSSAVTPFRKRIFRVLRPPLPNTTIL